MIQEKFTDGGYNHLTSQQRADMERKVKMALGQRSIFGGADGGLLTSTSTSLAVAATTASAAASTSATPEEFIQEFLTWLSGARDNLLVQADWAAAGSVILQLKNDIAPEFEKVTAGGWKEDLATYED